MFQSLSEKTKSVAQATKNGVVKGAEWARTDGVEYAKKGGSKCVSAGKTGVQKVSGALRK